MRVIPEARWSTCFILKITDAIYAQGADFYDIQNHWGKDYIETLVNEGGIVGYPDGTFKPDNLIKRGEFLKVVMSVLLGEDVLLSFYGNDNTNSHWASYILDAAYDFGIVNENEIPNTVDSLEKFITRYEMARIFVQAVHLYPSLGLLFQYSLVKKKTSLLLVQFVYCQNIR